MPLTLTTFNLENLFNRYSFLDLPYHQKNYEKWIMAKSTVSIKSRKGDLKPYATSQEQRVNTAHAILDAQPDVLAVCEIENLYTLRNFNTEFMKHHFDRMISLDGNDPRGIDVGLLIRKGAGVEVLEVRTHVDEAVAGKAIKRFSIANFGYRVDNALFSRDCLEADLKTPGGKVVTLLINHLKAQDKNVAKSRARRKVQAQRVAQLVTAAENAGRLPIVLGDLNTDPDANPGDDSLDPLLNHASLKDPFAGDAPAARWTHFYDTKKSVSRLDYLLVHKSIPVTATSIVRKGLSTLCKQYAGARYPGIKEKKTEASDHCPVSITMNI